MGSDLGSPEGFMEKLMFIKKKKCLSKSKQNIGENVVIECVFIDPLSVELNPICHLLHYLELTIFSTLAG